MRAKLTWVRNPPTPLNSILEAQQGSVLKWRVTNEKKRPQPGGAGTVVRSAGREEPGTDPDVGSQSAEPIKFCFRVLTAPAISKSYALYRGRGLQLVRYVPGGSLCTAWAEPIFPRVSAQRNGFEPALYHPLAIMAASPTAPVRVFETSAMQMSSRYVRCAPNVVDDLAVAERLLKIRQPNTLAAVFTGH
ncbi:hypothetical protein ACVWWO_007476 [Bradyrhizobium sp. F1.13.1]